jgi:pimeloyl-ACP methyl ester carboxylesterase
MDSLDRARFQAWFYFYPSGAALDSVSSHLATLLARLQVKHGFDRLALVAHSAGGLVARGAILKYAEETRRDDVRLFLTISTPWAGDVQAERVGDAPLELPPALSDMDPSSPYLRWLFWQDEGRTARRGLPAAAQFHMLIGFRMDGRARVSSDGTVSLASQARLEAQEEAASLRALDFGHVDILRSPEAQARLRQLLERRFP